MAAAKFAAERHSSRDSEIHFLFDIRASDITVRTHRAAGSTARRIIRTPIFSSAGKSVSTVASASSISTISTIANSA